MPHHHPTEEMLISYAAGSMNEPLALLVATHTALCPTCRSRVNEYEMFGGAVLDEEEPLEISSHSLERVMAQLDGDRPIISESPKPDPKAMDGLVLPQPLRGYVAEASGGLQWQRRGGFTEAELLPDAGTFRTSLMRIKPSTAMPERTHRGSEYTLVLAGGFSDETGHYVRGDVAVADTSVQHRPIADAGEDCVCLAVTDAPLHLTGPIGRLLNPFLHR